MTDHLDRFDDLLLRDLRELYAAADPVPAGMTDRIKTAMTVQRLHAELAELTRAPALATRAEPVRTDVLTFAATSLSLMVNVRETDDGLVLDGWVTVAGATVELHHDDATRVVETDEDGRFVFRSVPSGNVSFVVHPPSELGERPVVTPTVAL